MTTSGPPPPPLVILELKRSCNCPLHSRAWSFQWFSIFPVSEPADRDSPRWESPFKYFCKNQRIIKKNARTSRSSKIMWFQWTDDVSSRQAVDSSQLFLQWNLHARLYRSEDCFQIYCQVVVQFHGRKFDSLRNTQWTSMQHESDLRHSVPQDTQHW